MIIRLFGFQLLFNFTWSIFFFYFRSPLLGFANILVLDVLVIYYMIESYPGGNLRHIFLFLIFCGCFLPLILTAIY